MRISTQVAEEPLFQFCISKWRCFLRFCHVFAPAWFYVQKTFFTQCRITDSFEILNRAAASRVVSSSLRDFRTTVSRNSGVWRSFFHVIRSISWSYQSLTLPSRCFFNTKTFSDTTCAIVSGKIMINYNQSGFERIFWLCYRNLHLNQLGIQLLGCSPAFPACIYTISIIGKCNRQIGGVTPCWNCSCTR